MTRSVEELRRDSERSRAQLAATVDRLREQITDTAEDLRYKVSPQGIKSEVSEFVSRKSPRLARHAEAASHGKPDAGDRRRHGGRGAGVAAGTGLSASALDDRCRPCPDVEDRARSRAAEAAAPAIEKAREMVDEATERAQSLRRGCGGCGLRERATGGRPCGRSENQVSGIAGDLKDRVTQTADQVKAGIDAASDTGEETPSSGLARPRVTRRPLRRKPPVR